jgi:antitoxin (DNA-binding transcriptional repressor) of toxin-antitoxin stability system
MARLANITASVTEAKNKLTPLLAAVELGERVSLGRHGRVIAEMVQPTVRRVARFGTLKGVVEMTMELESVGGVSDLACTPGVQRLLEKPDTVRFVRPISVIEIATRANRGLTPLTRKQPGGVTP